MNAFCFTGKMEHSRDELEAMVEAKGGKVAAVSNGLTYLVMADPDSNSSKAKKARDLGTKTISEEAFLKMAGA